MRLLARLLWVLALPMLLTGGCAEVTTPEGAPVRATITSWPGIAVPLDGVELCETGTAKCVTTDANGEATLYLPAGERSFTQTKEGYGSYLVPLVVPEDGLEHSSGMGSDATLESLYEDVMSPYPLEDMGRISIGIAFAGATFDLFDATAGELAAKTFYVEEGPTGQPIWRLDLAATITDQGGGFLDVSPGEYQVRFGGTAEECIPGPTGWPGVYLLNSVRFPVRAGHVTQVTVSCSQVAN